jgi:hypothetical protein
MQLKEIAKAVVVSVGKITEQELDHSELINGKVLLYLVRDIPTSVVAEAVMS